MPVRATPAKPRLLSRDDVRRFMRDYVGVVPNTGTINILLDSVEFSNEDIEAGIAMTANMVTFMTPLIGTFTPDMIPPPFLLLGVARHLLMSESLRQLRNQATGQDGDVQPIGLDDKHQIYLKAADWMKDQFNELVKAWKVQVNMERAYGGLSSGYLNIGRFTTG